MTTLCDADRRIVARARELAGLPADRNREFTGNDDDAGARAEVLGLAKYLLGELADLAERLDGDEDQADEDTGRLGRIRVVPAGFDWEHDDRQLALEAIERIAEGGQP